MEWREDGEVLNKKEKNRFSITIKCPYHVTDTEWFEILLGLNLWLLTFKNGKFANVGAFLEDVAS